MTVSANSGELLIFSCLSIAFIRAEASFDLNFPYHSLELLSEAVAGTRTKMDTVVGHGLVAVW